MPRRDNCMLFQSFDPKSRTAPPPLPRSQLDGATREHTHKFREFRREFQEGRIALDGPRVGQLRQLLRDNDAQGLQRFLDAKRGSVVQLQPGQTCRWCNRRVAEAGAAGRPPARGRRAEGPGAPRLCQICREWHCAEHCNCLSRIVSGRYVLDITCCRQCSVFLDVQRWHREGRQALNKADDTTIGACLWVLADADAMLSACREVGLTHAPPRKVAGEAVIVKAWLRAQGGGGRRTDKTTSGPPRARRATVAPRSGDRGRHERDAAKQGGHCIIRTLPGSSRWPLWCRCSSLPTLSRLVFASPELAAGTRGWRHGGRPPEKAGV
ncbi:unnamed protein product, partial [Prorocentrum cordatum]